MLLRFDHQELVLSVNLEHHTHQQDNVCLDSRTGARVNATVVR